MATTPTSFHSFFLLQNVLETFSDWLSPKFLLSYLGQHDLLDQLEGLAQGLHPEQVIKLKMFHSCLKMEKKRTT